MEEKKSILIVEDERAIVEILKFNLMREGYDTLEALDGELGLELARTKDPDLILLDVMLPKMNGFEICQNLRDAGSTVPIIMLTAREEETDKVFGLEAGADDYMTKPFSMRELMARVRANIRRRSLDLDARASVGTLLKAGELVIEPSTFSVTKNGEPVDLTQEEEVEPVQFADTEAMPEDFKENFSPDTQMLNCCANAARCSRARTSCRRSGTTIILATCGPST